MPIYEYRCEACGHEMEALQKMSDDALVLCPNCSEPTLKKLLSATGFRLKGGGWYETDFKSRNKKNLHGDKDKKKESDKKADLEKKKDSKAASSGAGARASLPSSVRTRWPRKSPPWGSGRALP